MSRPVVAPSQPTAPPRTMVPLGALRADERRLRRGISAVLLIVAVTTMVLSLTDTSGPARAVLGFIFVVAVPGWAVTGHLALRWAAAEVTLTVASGLAISIVVGEVMLLAGAWQPGAATIVVGVAASASLVYQVWRPRDQGPAWLGGTSR